MNTVTTNRIQYTGLKLTIQKLHAYLRSEGIEGGIWDCSKGQLGPVKFTMEVEIHAGMARIISEIIQARGWSRTIKTTYVN